MPQVWQRPALCLRPQGPSLRNETKHRAFTTNGRWETPGHIPKPAEGAGHGALSGLPPAAPCLRRPLRGPPRHRGARGYCAPRPPEPQAGPEGRAREWRFSNNERQKLVPVGWNFLWGVQWDLGKESSLRISELGAPRGRARGDRPGPGGRRRGGALQPRRRGPSRQAPGPPPAAGPPCLAPLPPRPLPHRPFPFFLSRVRSPPPGGARSAARPMAVVPGRCIS